MQRTFLTLSACLSIAGVCRAESYTLKILRPEKVGYRADFSAKSLDQSASHATIGDKVGKEKAGYQVGSLDAVREVLAVNDKGKPTKLRFTVKSLLYTSEKGVEPKEILAGGKEVIAVRKGKEKTYTIDGEQAGEATAKALQFVISLGDESNGPDPDAMFNTKAPRAVGDEWDAGVDEIIRSMGTTMPLQFDRKASGGKVRLERVEKVAGVECCILTASIVLVPAGMQGLPDDADFTGSTYKMSMACPMPVDSAAPELGGKIMIAMALTADFKIPDGSQSKLEVTGTATHEERTRPIKQP